MTQVNGDSMEEASHQEAVMALIAPTHETILEVRHDPQPPGLQVQHFLMFSPVSSDPHTPIPHDPLPTPIPQDPLPTPIPRDPPTTIIPDPPRTPIPSDPPPNSILSDSPPTSIPSDRPSAPIPPGLRVRRVCMCNVYRYLRDAFVFYSWT